MTCQACGAPLGKARNHCVICGRARAEANGNTWSRDVDAAAYEGVSKLLEPGEALLGVTRGRIMGNWRPRFSLNPAVAFSPYANLGITAGRLLLQPVNRSTGQSPEQGASLDLKGVAQITAADADAFEPGRTVRLIVRLEGGEALRLKASGRMAEAARQLAGIWSALYGAKPEAAPHCASCGREWDQPHRFCPYCGKDGDADDDGRDD